MKVNPNPQVASHATLPGDDGEKVFGKTAIGPTYNMLRPEVKQCLDKVMYQLDLCKNTLGLLERRISNSESNLQHVMEFIRQEDINYRPYLAQATVQEQCDPSP